MRTSKFQYILISIITLCVIVSCEVDSKIDPDFEEVKKIAVFGFISPQDTQLKVEVSKLYTLNQIFQNNNLDRDSFIVKDAKVIISNNTTKKTMVYDSALKKYVLDASEIKIIEGESYSIEVTVAGYEVLTAKATIPKKNTGLLTPIDKKDNIGTADSVLRDNIFVEFNDIPNDKNYYHLFAATSPYANDEGEYNDFTAVNFEPTGDDFDFTGYNYGYPKSYLITDNKLDGKKIRVGGRKGYYYNNENNEKIKVKVYLLTVDEYYFDYHQLVLTHESDNPLVEPANIKGNVVNGLGVFSGFQTHYQEFLIDQGE